MTKEGLQKLEDFSYCAQILGHAKIDDCDRGPEEIEKSFENSYNELKEYIEKLESNKFNSYIP